MKYPRCIVFLLLTIALIGCTAKSKHKSILIATIPKSGTVYIQTVLQNCFGSPIHREPILTPFPDLIVDQPHLDSLMKKGCLVIHHYPPAKENLEKLSHHFDRIIVHVRDPRQCLTSMTFHIAKNLALHMQEEQEYTSVSNLCEIEADFYKYSLEQKIDWVIDHFYVNCLDWIARWVDFAENHNELDIMFTSYDDLREHPVEFFTSILAFNGISTAQFKEKHLPKKEKGKLHFRKGDSQEWRSVLTPEQQKRVTAMIPQEYFERFAWKR
ncbi:MAG: sulfotransferase domain-containing protein [Chlamydiales bacterium]|nr:sulfotransferase domain-containing protein [Chlamydiales bacterium]